jgi:hypothetical protein
VASYEEAIDGAVYSKFDAKLESCAIMPSMRGFGFKNKNFRDFFTGNKA